MQNAERKYSALFILNSAFKDGGPPRNCTGFCGLRDRYITNNVCDPVRDAKAELNRRSQACEVLAGTGVRVAEMDGHEGIAPRISVWPAIQSSGSWTEKPSFAQGYGGHPSLHRKGPRAKDGRPACISQHLCPGKWLAEP